MRGGFRLRKKRLKQAGWHVVEEIQKGDKQYQIVMQTTSGDRATIEATTRPRAYMQAEHKLLFKVSNSENPTSPPPEASAS
jgi:hypothetical protein